MDLEYLEELYQDLSDLEEEYYDVRAKLEELNKNLYDVKEVLGKQIDYIKDNFIEDDEITKEDFEGLRDLFLCGDPEEEEEKEEADIVVSFYDALK